MLKYGSEEQRVALLSQLVAKYVGGVNAALAATPEGKLKQAANRMGDLQARLGGLIVSMQSAFQPAIAKIGEGLDAAIGFFERHKDKIREMVGTIARVVGAVVGNIGKLVRKLLPVLGGVYAALKTITSAVITALPYVSAAFAVWLAYMTAANAKFLIFAARYYAYIAITKAAAFFTNLWSGAQAVLNAVMYANPVGLIVAAIVALIAAIAYVVYKTDGWGKQWESVVNYMKNSFYATVEAIKFYFNSWVNGFMVGLDYIKLGWYKFREAVGMGEGSENRAAIAKIHADIEARKNAIAEGAARVKALSQAAKDSLKWELSWNSERSLSDLTDGLKKKLGFGANEQLQAAAGGGDASAPGGGLSAQAGKGAEAVATGGTRSTTINIQVGKMIETVRFEGSSGENKEGIEKNFAEAFYRVLAVAETSASA
jgi:phage-related protein